MSAIDKRTAFAYLPGSDLNNIPGSSSAMEGLASGKRISHIASSKGFLEPDRYPVIHSVLLDLDIVGGLHLHPSRTLTDSGRLQAAFLRAKPIILGQVPHRSIYGPSVLLAY